jgi:hypothetical protein
MPPLIVPTALLRHTRDADDVHFDWLIAQDEAACEPLITLQVPRAVHEMTANETVVARRIPDHRTAYLTYEGPVSGDRGQVSRVARGEATLDAPPASASTIAVNWSTTTARYAVVRSGHDSADWRVTCLENAAIRSTL